MRDQINAFIFSKNVKANMFIQKKKKHERERERIQFFSERIVQ